MTKFRAVTAYRRMSSRCRLLRNATILILGFINGAVAAVPSSEILRTESDRSAELTKVYAALRYAPLWYGTTEAVARRMALQHEIDGRSLRGLPPDEACPRTFKPEGNSDQSVARSDLALTTCLLKYRDTLATGAVNSATFGKTWYLAGEHLQLSAADLAEIRRGDVAAVLDASEPQFRDYQDLRASLANYQAIEARGGWPKIPGSTEVLLDGSDTRAWAVRDRLTAEGYFPANGASDLAGIKNALTDFQARHGLATDGRVGKQTLAALNITVPETIAIISVNLERWRHVPRYLGRAHIAVNVADASLVLVQEDSVTAHMLTIVGDPKHQTPLFEANVTAITLNPSWTIPTSIAAREMLPKLRRDPLYLQKNDIIILGRESDPNGLQVDWRRILPAHFPFQLRQRPGSRNPLGLIKFEMANGFDVYLHDTSARALFARPRRGLSHGCVRVEQPATLAQRLLPGWGEADIQAAIATGETRTIPLPQPLPVYLLYWTAFVDDAGHINFRNDLYDQDRAIALALGLTAPSAPNTPVRPVATANCLAPA